MTDRVCYMCPISLANTVLSVVLSSAVKIERNAAGDVMITSWLTLLLLPVGLERR